MSYLLGIANEQLTCWWLVLFIILLYWLFNVKQFLKFFVLIATTFLSDLWFWASKDRVLPRARQVVVVVVIVVVVFVVVVGCVKINWIEFILCASNFLFFFLFWLIEFVFSNLSSIMRLLFNNKLSFCDMSFLKEGDYFAPTSLFIIYIYIDIYLLTCKYLL